VLTSRTPRERAAELERWRARPPGAGDRFTGYGVLALPFESGHVLGFYRVSAGTIGPPHTAVWHRCPEGGVTLHVDIAPTRTCARYFGPAFDEVRVSAIELVWTGPQELQLTLPAPRLHWVMRVAASRALIRPGIAWRDVAGRTPSGHRFRLSPRSPGRVVAGAALLRERDLGPIAPDGEAGRIGWLALPAGGVLAFGEARFEAGARAAD
jgi:hypothetical protein